MTSLYVSFLICSIGGKIVFSTEASHELYSGLKWLCLPLIIHHSSSKVQEDYLFAVTPNAEWGRYSYRDERRIGFLHLLGLILPLASSSIQD